MVGDTSSEGICSGVRNLIESNFLTQIDRVRKLRLVHATSGSLHRMSATDCIQSMPVRPFVRDLMGLNVMCITRP